jgi:hypothetical protein
MNEHAGSSAVAQERGIWSPRFFVQRFENADAHTRFRQRLTTEVKWFASDPAWRERVERATHFTKKALADVAIAHLPMDLQLELSRQFSFGVTEAQGNILVNAGINSILLPLLCGAGTALSAANARLGVGDSATAASAAQTDLQAVTNKLRVAMMNGYPTYGTNQKATFCSSFGGSNANWHWQEMATFNAASGATSMLNRKVSDQGTKTTGQAWVLTEEVTFS